MGQGALTILRKIVAHTIGLPLEHVIYRLPDTDQVPDSGPTVASRTTMIVGSLIQQAALEIKERWDESGEFSVQRTYEQPDHIQWDQETMRGDAYPAYSWGVIIAEVTVESDTGQISVDKIWSAFDVGTAMDDLTLRGQIDGGIAQSIGWAIMENLEIPQGVILQDKIRDYCIPTSLDLPPIQSRTYNNPYDSGPFGAKGAGELTFIGTAPAIAVAVEHALGEKMNHLPLTPERVLLLIGDNSHRGNQQ